MAGPRVRKGKPASIATDPEQGISCAVAFVRTLGLQRGLSSLGAEWYRPSRRTMQISPIPVISLATYGRFGASRPLLARALAILVAIFMARPLWKPGVAKGAIDEVFEKRWEHCRVAC